MLAQFGWAKPSPHVAVTLDFGMAVKAHGDSIVVAAVAARRFWDDVMNLHSLSAPAEADAAPSFRSR